MGEAVTCWGPCSIPPPPLDRICSNSVLLGKFSLRLNLASVDD